MSRQYYTLVAGLRELMQGAENKGFDAAAIIAEVRTGLSEHDNRYVDLFYSYYDVGNAIAILGGRQQFSELGNFTRDELEQEMKSPERLPDYMADVLRSYADPDNPDYDNDDNDDTDRSATVERALWSAYYRECARSHCRFIREWFEFDRTLRNVGAALTARRLGLPVAQSVVGDDFVTQALGRSSAADFGLGGEVEYVDRIIAATAEGGNLLEKERMVDDLRWEMADELTTFDYFDINAVLAYLAKVNIIHRWVSLDPETGREMFRRMVSSMSAPEMIAREVSAREVTPAVAALNGENEKRQNI